MEKNISKQLDIWSAEGKICSYFVKGNSYILKKYHDLFKDLDFDKKTHLFEQLWNTEFKAKLHKKNTNYYSTLLFENETDLFLFFLKIK
jgi:hypothetical protein